MMDTPLKTRVSTTVGLLLARLPMGAFFLLAGYQKIFQVGVGKFVHEASRSPRMPDWAPPAGVSAYLHAVPFLELVVGILLVLGLVARVGGLIGSLMVVSFIIGATGLRDPNLPFTPNLIYLGVLLLVLLAGPGRISLDAVLLGRKKIAV